jgi:dihydrofolate reductase
MSKVFTHMTMSLDGYIADPDDRPGELFDWYEAGEASVASPNEDVAFNVDEASAEALRELTENAGALVSGRRLFDIANGWNDTHPSGAPVVVVTHRPPADAAQRWPRTNFVDGVEAIRTSRSPAPASRSRRSTSAWWTRYASALYQCCSARACPTFPN